MVQVPFQVMAAGCGGFVQPAVLAPMSCVAEPTKVGLIMAGKPGQRRAVWRAFACDEHADVLLAARPLLPRDRDVLARRREKRRVLLAGRRYAGEDEGPLARGRAADELVKRARAWAAAHPDGRPRETGPG